jgi:hypothetical protein
MARLRERPAQPELSFTSGLFRNFELVIGPWCVILGGFLSYQLIFFHPEATRADEPMPPALVVIPLIALVVGLALTYQAYFRGVVRLEITDGTLYWFTPFHRLRGSAPVTDVVSIWSSATFEWNRTRTVIQLRDGRRVSVHDAQGIGMFVFTLIARVPRIDAKAWKAHEPLAVADRVPSFYVKDDE